MGTSELSSGQVWGTGSPASSTRVGYRSIASTNSRVRWSAGMLVVVLVVVLLLLLEVVLTVGRWNPGASASMKSKLLSSDVTPGTWSIMGILRAISKLVVLHHSALSPRWKPVDGKDCYNSPIF